MNERDLALILEAEAEFLRERLAANRERLARIDAAIEEMLGE